MISISEVVVTNIPLMWSIWGGVVYNLRFNDCSFSLVLCGSGGGGGGWGGGGGGGGGGGVEVGVG